MQPDVWQTEDQLVTAEAPVKPNLKKRPSTKKSKRASKRARQADTEVVSTLALPPKSDLQADGDSAVNLERDVPLQKRQLNVPPLRKIRSGGGQLSADFGWWMEGAYSAEGVPLRDGGISNSVARSLEKAENANHRFCAIIFQRTVIRFFEKLFLMHLPGATGTDSCSSLRMWTIHMGSPITFPMQLII